MRGAGPLGFADGSWFRGFQVGSNDMNRYIRAAAAFFFLTCFGVICSAPVYLMFWGVIWWICDSFEVPDRFHWIPLAATALVFVSAVIASVRNQLPDLTELKWDSATTEDSPSRFSIQGKGGHLWNMNPLGPQSSSSMVAILALILGFGPSFLVNAVIFAVEEIRGNG